MKNINSFSSYEDFLYNLKNPGIWAQISFHDIKQRYKRSKIGPLWVTISTSIVVFFLSILYSKLLNVPLENYLPYIAISLILWGLISVTILESCEVFIGSSQMLLQLRLPFYFYIFRLVSRNFIIFAHNSILLILVMVIYPELFNFEFLIFLPISLILYFISGVSIGMICGILCTRFRDITHIAINLVQLSFFMTPILWKKEMIEENNRWIIDFNIFNHYLDIMRSAFLNQDYAYKSLLIVVIFTFILFMLSFLMFRKYKKQINYWL